MRRTAAKIRKDMEALLETIRRDWLELATISATVEQREQIRLHIQWAYDELGSLLAELDAAASNATIRSEQT